MIDLNNITHYHENNRLEIKKAVGGLPKSIWETYSAFANTAGGVILLGIEENDDHSFNVIGLPEPERLVKEFWDTINNPNKVSTNILLEKNISIEIIDDKKIIVIDVPRAQRFNKPIYINNNPINGTYRRNGEGDYHCSKEEIQSMYRDASYKTPDALVLENMKLTVIDYDSLHRYRNRMKYSRPGHVWNSLVDDEFLYALGAAGIGEDGKLHPTGAGLLMFGHDYEIVKEFPDYFLDYQEQYDETMRWTDRLISTSGDWSGNLFDFFFHVYNKIAPDLKVPFKMEGINRIDDTPVHKAIREALANCLVNADYYGRRGVVIIKKREVITLSNPGGFRVDMEAAKFGGVSDPRNGIILKMFNFIDIGERAGSGIPNIYSVWKAQGWGNPIYKESFNPDRIQLSLPISTNGKSKNVTIKSDDKQSDDKKVTIKSDDKKTVISENGKTLTQKAAIVKYLNNNIKGTNSDFCELLGVKSTRVKVLLSELIAENIVIAEGANRNRKYKLKV